MQAHGNRTVGREQIRPSRITAGVRRLAVVSTILSLASVVSISTAGASADSRVAGSVSGQAPFDGACGLLHQRFITTVDITHGPQATLLVDTCVTSVRGGDTAVLNGTFVFTAPSGTLTGTANGTAPLFRANPIPFDFTLTVTQGTQSFAHTSGTLRLDVQWTQATDNNSGPVTGALTAALTH
jgi:hypothetical protein